MADAQATASSQVKHLNGACMCRALVLSNQAPADKMQVAEKQQGDAVMPSLSTAQKQQITSKLKHQGWSLHQGWSVWESC